MYVSVRRKHGMILRRVYIRRYSGEKSNYQSRGRRNRQCTENLARTVLIVVGNVVRYRDW